MCGLADDANQVIVGQIDTPTSCELAICLWSCSKEDCQLYGMVIDLHAEIFPYAGGHRHRHFAFEHIDLVLVQIAARVPIMVEHIQCSLVNSFAKRGELEPLSLADNETVSLKGIASRRMNGQR